MIESNPAERIKNAKVQKEPPDPLTAEEVDVVLKHMQKYDAQIGNHPHHRNDDQSFSDPRTLELCADVLTPQRATRSGGGGRSDQGSTSNLD